MFFGRTAAVASVLLKLRRQAERGKAFVLIVGMSGGGKSSLVRAGVLPLLLQPGVVGRRAQSGVTRSCGRAMVKVISRLRSDSSAERAGSAARDSQTR